MRAIKIASLMALSTIACAQALPADQSLKSINVIPIGGTDRPLPTLKISTVPFEESFPFHYNDVVSEKLYAELSSLIHRKTCAGATGGVDKTVGEFGTIVVEELSQDGGMKLSCRVERPAVDEFVNAVGHIYEKERFESDAIKTWQASLKRGH